MTTQGPYPSWPPAAPYPPQPQPQPRPPRTRPRYSRFAALVLSFFSAPLYRDVARNWGGIALLYLLLVMFLTWLPVLVKGHVGLRKAVQDPQVNAIVDELPSVTINKGVVSIQEPEPYIVRDPQTGRALLYVDTTNRFDRPEAAQAVALLGRSTLEMRQPNKTEVHDLSRVDYLYVDAATVRRWVDAMPRLYAVFALPAVLVWSLAWGLVRMLIYGLIGMMFASIFNARLDYAALLRLSAVAMTPGMVLDMISWLAAVPPPMPCCGWSFIIGAITVGYLAFAVRANSQPAVPPGGYGYTDSFPASPPPAYAPAPPPAPPGPTAQQW